jgi:hypothetical protein
MGFDDRQFATFRRGQIRDDIILGVYRSSLAAMVNPVTGAVFTADEILRATQPGSRFYIEADAIDLYGMSLQSRGALLADQVDASRANTRFLEGYHAKQWIGDDARLPAVGGGGTGQFKATTGSIFPGSTTLGDPTAAVATDPNGKRYQVLEEVIVEASDNGIVNLPMRGVDTGVITNIPADTVLTWAANAPLGAEPAGKALANFSGGFDVETDAELAERVAEIIRYRPGNGNAAQFMAWAREASVAVERAFVYPCAMHSGTTMVAILQKRQGTDGPASRIDPDETTMADAIHYLTPPLSPVVKEGAFVIVVSPTGQSSNMVVRISLGLGRNGGWYDSVPWPNPSDQLEAWEVQVTDVTSQTEFDVETSADLPGGASSLSGDDAPQIMIWDEDTSRFERLLVSSISKSGDTATITLSEAPTHTIAEGDRISPYTDQLETVAIAAENYFDELGPGEVVDIDTDPRGDRAARFPPPHERYPTRAGQSIVTRIVDALGNVAPDASLVYCSRNEPSLPGQIIDGPYQVILGHLTVLPL